MQARPKKTQAPALSQLDRLARLPMRFGKLKSEAALHATIVSEAKKLLGAQRVLLVLQRAADAPTIAGSKLPAGESAEGLLRSVAPWLAEALETGASRLRHGPEGAAPREQRSCLVAPSLAPQGPLGCLYADIEGQRGRFDDADRGLLAAFAAQAAMALAHLRGTGALQQEVALRTAEATETLAAQKATADVLEVIVAQRSRPSWLAAGQSRKNCRTRSGSHWTVTFGRPRRLAHEALMAVLSRAAPDPIYAEECTKGALPPPAALAPSFDLLTSTIYRLLELEIQYRMAHVGQDGR